MRKRAIIFYLFCYLLVNAAEIPNRNASRAKSLDRLPAGYDLFINKEKVEPEILKFIGTAGSRRRLLYALNFQKGVLESYSHGKSKSKQTVVARNYSGNHHIGKNRVSSNSLMFPKTPLFSSKILMAYRTENSSLSGEGFEKELLDHSDGKSTGVITSLGVKKSFLSPGSLDLDFFLHKFREGPFRLEKISLSYKYPLLESSMNSIIPQLTVFIPSSSYRNEVDKGERSGNVFSPSLHIKTNYFNFVLVKYGLYYYYNNSDPSKNLILNVVSFDREIVDTVRAVATLSHFAESETKGRLNSALTIYHTILLKNLRQLKLAVTMENSSTYRGDFSYTLTAGYNY